MPARAEITRKLKTVFEPDQAEVLTEVITEAYTDLVKTSDFNELKAIVKELAVAQQRTEQRVEELAVAQQRTEQRVEELAVAQKELAVAQQRTEKEIQQLTRAMRDTRAELGGLSRSMSYALENEAYRTLPAFLKEQHGMEITGRLVRTEIGGEEINFFGHARRNGEAVLIVGETKLRLDERRRSRREEETIFSGLERKVEAVRAAYPGEKIVRLLITHYARPAVLRQAEARGIIVVQSFEW